MNHIKSIIRNIIAQGTTTDQIIEATQQMGGIAYAVGGMVRDIIIHQIYNVPLVIHDIDIEIHGLTYEQLEKILSAFGPVSFVGKSFGILKLHSSNVDFALPRSDSAGRKPTVEIDPFMGIETALRRRDLTMNAMAINLHTYELIDPFGGYEDIKASRLRSPDLSFFGEDPLRFYRVMQFISRFGYSPDTQLTQLCRTMDISKVSVERIEQEFQKLLLLSKRPSLGIRWLADIERLEEILPELYKTMFIPQDPEWHPEGAVFEHLMQTLDAAARFSYNNEEQQLIGLYAALCHDLGKTVTTIEKDGRIRSPGHDEAGVPLCKSMLSRITSRKDLLHKVPLLIRRHMQPSQLIKSHSGDGAYKRLASYFDKQVTIEQLVLLCYADKQGRNGENHIPFTELDPGITRFKEHAEKLGILYGPEEPILHGKDLALFVAPGPEMGRLLDKAYALQINRGIIDKERLLGMIVPKKKRP